MNPTIVATQTNSGKKIPENVIEAVKNYFKNNDISMAGMKNYARNLIMAHRPKH